MSAIYSILKMIIRISVTLMIAVIISAPGVLSQTHIHTHPIMTTLNPSVILYEEVNFGGKSTTMAAGKSALTGRVSSIKVPQGFVAMLYEYADDGGGYGKRTIRFGSLGKEKSKRPES